MDALDDFQQILGSRLIVCFHSCLAQRSFCGSLKINHGTNRLDIVVSGLPGGACPRWLTVLCLCFQSLEKVMTRRNQAYTEFKRMIALRTKYFFIVMLSHRQYIGRMNFNHKTQSLEMWVRGNYSALRSPCLDMCGRTAFPFSLVFCCKCSIV